MQPVKWGIVSTANIGTKKVIPAMLKAKGVEIVGIASRDLSRAQAAANELGIPKAYGTYEELLADPAYTVEEDYIKEFFITIRRFNEQVMNDPNYAALLDSFGANLLYPSGSRALKRKQRVKRNRNSWRS